MSFIKELKAYKYKKDKSSNNKNITEYKEEHWDLFFKEYLFLFSKKKQKEILDYIFGESNE